MGIQIKTMTKCWEEEKGFINLAFFSLYCLCSQHLYNSNSNPCKWKRVKYLLSLPFLGKEAMRQTGKRETERVHGKRLLLIFDPTLICIFYTIFVSKEKWECNQLDLLQSTFQYSQTSLSLSIHIKILPNWSPYISLRISWENNLIIEQGIFSWVIILFILLTYLSTVYRYQ